MMGPPQETEMFHIDLDVVLLLLLLSVENCLETQNVRFDLATHLLITVFFIHCIYFFFTRNHEKMISQEIRLLRRAASCVDPMDNSDRDR